MKISTTGNDRNRISRRSAGRSLIALLLASSLAAGCAAGRGAYHRGLEAELRENYDEALVHYETALAEKPGDIEYRLKVQQARFAAAFRHFQNGRRAIDAGNLEEARASLIRAVQLDPTNQLARSELEKIDGLLASETPLPPEQVLDFNTRKELARTDPSMGARLPAIFEENIAQLVMTQTADAIYQSIADLVDLNVIFDSDWTPQPLSIDLSDISIFDALDIVALQTNTFWEPINDNTIVVSVDNPTKRDTYETTMVKTIYMTNSVNPADLTEAITAIRTLLGIALIAQSTSMNAIMVRGTPDQIAIAEKIVDDFDKSRAEVLVEATVLEVDRNTLRDLGILPPQGTQVFLNEAAGGGENGAGQVPLSDLDTLDGRSFSMTIPPTVANFLVSDINTRLVQNPSVRATDGVQAQIHIGSRVPVASGSFQPAFVGATGTPVVQFQYIDVGVNMDITPRVLLSREISLQVNVQVQATAGTNVISGVALPQFTNRSVNHTIRLNEGETNILGGLITNTESDESNGIPGLNRIPGLRYLFSSQTTSVDQTEIIILLTPHIVRMPDLYERNIQGLDIGTESNTRLRQAPIGPVALPPLAPVVPEPATTPDAGADSTAPGADPAADTDSPAVQSDEPTIEPDEPREIVVDAAFIDRLDAVESGAGSPTIASSDARCTEPLDAPVSVAAVDGGTGRLTGVRYCESASGVRIVVDMDRATTFRTGNAFDPPRVFLDLASSIVGDEVPSRVTVDSPGLAGIRIGQFEPTTARVVLDETVSERVDAFMLANPHRLIIDVRAPDAEGDRTTVRPVQNNETAPGPATAPVGGARPEPGQGVGPDPGAPVALAPEREPVPEPVSSTAPTPDAGTNDGRIAEDLADDDALAFENEELMLEPGETREIIVHIDAGLVQGAEMTIDYDPASVTLKDVRDGGFLSQGGANISIARNVDAVRGTATVSVERSPLAPAVSGEGEVLRLVVEALRQGSSVLRIDGFRVHDGASGERRGQDAEVTVRIQ